MVVLGILPLQKPRGGKNKINKKGKHWKHVFPYLVCFCFGPRFSHCGAVRAAYMMTALCPVRENPGWLMTARPSGLGGPGSSVLCFTLSGFLCLLACFLFVFVIIIASPCCVCVASLICYVFFCSLVQCFILDSNLMRVPLLFVMFCVCLCPSFLASVFRHVLCVLVFLSCWFACFRGSLLCVMFIRCHFMLCAWNSRTAHDRRAQQTGWSRVCFFHVLCWVKVGTRPPKSMSIFSILYKRGGIVPMGQEV